MGQLGIGVMINTLRGNEKSINLFKSVLGKTIKGLELSDNVLHFTFTDGTKIKIFDNGQDCCENRYMRTDDELRDFIGAQLLDATLKDAPSETLEYGDEHEVQFLEIKTSIGVFTMSNHNEHNGYYGGFSIEVAKN